MQNQRIRQHGSSMIEVLVAVLIFSVGILGIIGMQATAVTMSTNAKYRSDATLLANALIGKMWVSDRTQITLQTAFSGKDPAGTVVDGAEYLKWAWEGSTSGTAGNPASGTVFEVLPGSSAHPPVVAISPVGSGAVGGLASSLVTVTIYWKTPSDQVEHNFVAVAQIGG